MNLMILVFVSPFTYPDEYAFVLSYIFFSLWFLFRDIFSGLKCMEFLFQDMPLLTENSLIKTWIILSRRRIMLRFTGIDSGSLLWRSPFMVTYILNIVDQFSAFANSSYNVWPILFCLVFYLDILKNPIKPTSQSISF